MKAAIHYLILVGIPVLGVLGLLQLGEGVTPPVSVGGKWQLQLDSQVACDACSHRVGCNDHPTLTISQSGTHLSLVFDDEEKTTLTGRIDGLAITAKATELSMEVSLDRQAKPDHLSGKISFNGCSSSIPLQAVRRLRPLETKGSH
jgi:hypothetical protein